MFCKYCGKEIEDGKEVCEECAQNQTKVVEEPVKEENIVNTQNIEGNNTQQNNTQQTAQTNFNNTQVNNTQVSSKSKIAAGLFGIFLGSFGVHNFYLGYTGKAVAQLLITVLSCGILSPISAIWGLIEGILILAGDTSKDAYGNDLKE